MNEITKFEAIKTIADFSFKLQAGINLSLQDGLFQLDDIKNFKEAFLVAPFVPSAIKSLKNGLSDLSEQEKNDLKEYFVKNFDIQNDKIEELIEKSLLLSIDLFDFASKAKK